MKRIAYGIQPGQRFGRLTTVRLTYVPTEHRNLWSCVCDCNNQTQVRPLALQSGATKSCGCASVEHLRLSRRKNPGHAGSMLLWGQYKQGASERGLAFALDFVTFLHLTSNDCHYCGAKPERVRRPGSKNMTEEGRERAAYVFNGIDRIDNTKGYLVGNCVPCCQQCNFAKKTTAYSDFLQWATKIAARHSETRLCSTTR